MKTIIQYKNGIPLKSYKTISEIQRKKGYLKSHISECLNGKRKTAYGYEWRYQTKIKGRLKYYFKNKHEIIKDIGFLADMCEKYGKELEKHKSICNTIKELIDDYNKGISSECVLESISEVIEGSEK